MLAATAVSTVPPDMAAPIRAFITARDGWNADHTDYSPDANTICPEDAKVVITIAYPSGRIVARCYPLDGGRLSKPIR